MNKSKNIIFIFFSVLVIIISLPFFIKNSSLYFFKGTTLNEKSIVEKILKETEYGKDLKEFNILDNTLNINYDLDYIKYEILERNSSILFYLIEDLDYLNYSIGNEKYLFEREQIEKIYSSFKEIDINDINERYEKSSFEHTYLGNIDGIYDLFDISALCLEKLEKIYQDDNYVYYISCSSLESIVLISNNNQYELSDALEQKLIKVDDLFKTNIKISKEGIDSSEDIS